MKFPEFFTAVGTRLPEAFENDGASHSAPVDEGAASWIVAACRPDSDVPVVEIEVPETPEPPDADAPGLPSPDPDAMGGYGRQGADALACYEPFHRSPEGWGIYFFERPFFAFVHELAQDAHLAPGALAPVVLRQVLFHELTHFRFEVVGTELEDVLGRPLYLDYLRHRFRQPAAGLSGPIEETLASWSEVRFARDKLPQFLRPKPASYPQAVEAAASAAPPGYRDWNHASSIPRRERLVAELAALIADVPVATGAWGSWLSRTNRRSVPKFWVGDPRLIPNIGALQKSHPQVSIRVFERWLRAQGIEPVPRRGSHKKFVFGGRRDGYGTSEGRLLRKDAKRLSRFFGYPTLAEFLLAVNSRNPSIPRRAAVVDGR